MIGALGESLAAEYLRKKGYKLLATNYRCRFGEIDLIVYNKKYLVFVEVKSRKSDTFAKACEHVDFYKQQRLRTTAEIFLSQNQTDLQPRFDVIEVYVSHGAYTTHPRINHMEDAF